MTDAEIEAFIASSRTGTLATNGANGKPELTTVWFGVIDGDIWFETAATSEAAENLARDPRMSFLLKDGLTYDTLRGVSVEGIGEIINDHESQFRVGVAVWERYNGPYTDDLRSEVEQMISDCVAVRVVHHRTRSWDHRKLGMPPMPLGGTTAPAQ